VPEVRYCAMSVVSAVSRPKAEERILVRCATLGDVPALRTLIDRSVRGLQSQDYTAGQIEQALATVYGVDTQLIEDGTYYVAEPAPPDLTAGGAPESTLIGCGGWSKRRTLFGGDQFARREDTLLDPRHDAAKIRAFFVDPDWARRGIGTLILDACERAAFGAGFARLEMGATLTGVPFYRARGYTESDHFAVSLPLGESLMIVRMQKSSPVAAR
jgi:GNAT superfamily N-acetyltransferase